MKYPFEYSTTMKADTLTIKLTNPATKMESQLELYGLNADEYDLSDERIGQLLDHLMEQGIEAASTEPVPEFKTLGDNFSDYEAVEFVQKVMSIADDVTAKQLAIRMWGVKKK